jgi:ATP-dependent phosphofructokinase / diphosphate-dependent phosphofructokinase
MPHTTCPNFRRIGILTGGGDCPGLNAVIRAVGKDAINCGIEVIGIEDGFLGLIENRCRRLTFKDVSGILTQGGTILGSNNKSNPERHCVGHNPDGSPIHKNVIDECFGTIKQHRIEALVVIGGDGTMSGAINFCRRGLPVVGVPKTIDNDIEGTELTFGFQSAVATATQALDQVQTTADSHHRAMVVEVMGRNAGWIALHSGIAAGADVILIPEIPFSIAGVIKKVRQRSEMGKRSSLLCVSEGAKLEGGKQIVARVIASSPDPIRLGGIGKYLADLIEDETQIESRYCVLGHTQRGGTPVAADRVLSTLLGSHAMTLLREGKCGRMVAIQGGKLTDIDMETPAGRQRLVKRDDPLITAARAVGTSFGD